MSIRLTLGQSVVSDKLEQIRVALDNLAATQPPELVYDEEGNDITDPAVIAAYEQSYGDLRQRIFDSAGADFSTGVSLAGHDTTTIKHPALVACLVNALQIGHTLKWFSS